MGDVNTRFLPKKSNRERLNLLLRTPYTMDSNLEGFIRFLEDNDLVEFDIMGDDYRHYINRLKLQKYAFIAKYFGMPFHYKHSINLHGPYSEQLAVDYDSLALDGRRDTVSPMSNPVQFREGDFLKAIRNDPSWLEIATILLDRHNVTKDLNILVEEVDHVSIYDIELIVNVLDDLKAHGLVSHHPHLIQ